MSARIGWYVHHHGRGHLTRMLAIVRQLDARVHCFSSLARPDHLPVGTEWTVLERDDDARAGAPDPRAADPTAGDLLHWAPLRHEGHLRRLSAIASALASCPVDAFVVDVSVEVALLVRLLGVPVVLFAQPGHREDDAHQLGFRAATTIIAPWPRALLEPAHLRPVSSRVVYTGGISRFEGRGIVSVAQPPDVLMLAGAGGSTVVADDIAAAERSSCRAWRVRGDVAGGAWVKDPWSELATAGVVVAWAGQNSVADIAAAGARAVIIAQERPFGEQRATGNALARAGLAVVPSRWPRADRWQEVLEHAERLTPDWTRWEVDGAALRAANAILDTAGRGR